MRKLSYLAVENFDLFELAQQLPVERVTLSDLRPAIARVAKKVDVVELLRPDARRHLKHSYLGLEAK